MSTSKIITILDVHHVIYHPLSRILSDNYQDKDGCSRNGFLEFLFDDLFDSFEDYYHDWWLDLYGYSDLYFDYRGCPYKIQLKMDQLNDLPSSILDIKSCFFTKNHKGSKEDKIENIRKSAILNGDQDLPFIVHMLETGNIPHGYNKEFINHPLYKWIGYDFSEILFNSGHIISLYNKWLEACNFRTLSDSLPYLKHLSVSICEDSKAYRYGQESFVGLIRVLTSLVSLEISSIYNPDNVLNPQEIYDEIGYLTNLRDLTIENCNIHSWKFFSCFSNLTKLSSLKLSDLDGPKSEFPDFIYSMTQLTNLSLKNCEIRGSFPSKLSKLCHLTHIDFVCSFTGLGYLIVIS